MIIVMHTINGLAAAIAMAQVFYETSPELEPSRLEATMTLLGLPGLTAGVNSGRATMTSTVVRPSSAMLESLAC